MQRNSMIVAVIALAGLFAASPAWAGCAKRDLNGAYQLYVNWVDAGVLGWSRCDLVIRSGGSVKPGTTCVDSDGTVTTFTGGNFTVTSSCMITGQVTLDDGTVSDIDHAFFDLSRNVIVGVGHDVGGDPLSFTAVRK